MLARILLVLFLCTAPPLAVEAVAQQNMCADCDLIREKLRIVNAKAAGVRDSLEVLREAEREFRANRNTADGFAAAYGILQSINISLGIATLPCSIPRQWLKGLFGGGGGLSALIGGGGAGKVALSSVVGYLGLGVFSDAYSAVEAMKEYSENSAHLRSLGSHIRKTRREFQSAERRLAAERENLEHQLSAAGCEPDVMDFMRR